MNAIQISPEKDISTLSWVLAELRKSFDASSKSLKSFVQETKALQSDLATVDIQQVRAAKFNLHQAKGALELLKQDESVAIVGAMELVINKFTQQPELVTDNSVERLEYASFAVTEYLESLVAGKDISAIAMFSQYRDVMALGGFDKTHPADLWVRPEFVWHDPQVPTANHLAYSLDVRQSIDSALLKVILTSDSSASKELKVICLGLAVSQVNIKARIFWKICATFFESLEQCKIPIDVYTKRATSGILAHYNNLRFEDWNFSEKFMHNLLFFCDQAQIESSVQSPCLSAVKKAWELTTKHRIDYSKRHFGFFDPALLGLAKKRIFVAKDMWTLLSSGNIQKIRSTNEQFKLVSESLLSLYPSSKVLTDAMLKVAESIVIAKVAPSAELAMEVATAILYLEAVFEGWSSNHQEMEARANKLALRMERVRNGGQSEAVEPWMEELYRHVSDKESMSSVVGELRSCLLHIEKSIDQYFRQPNDKAVLLNVPNKFGEMRGIFSVLGLSQAASAVVKMRERVEEFCFESFDFEEAIATKQIDKFGNNLGVLGFLIDMLNHQPSLVKSLFVYDSVSGDLNPLMGRETRYFASLPTKEWDTREVNDVALGENTTQLPELSITDKGINTDSPPQIVSFVAESEPSKPVVVIEANKQTSVPLANTSVDTTTAPVSKLASNDSLTSDEHELRAVFFEEVKEVILTGLQVSNKMLHHTENADNLESQSVLRRAFHTLKGSARMVGLNEFGEAAWSFEQLVITRLTDQKWFEPDFCKLCIAALNSFDLWAKDLRDGDASVWRPDAFRYAADLMRVENILDRTGLDKRATIPNNYITNHLIVEKELLSSSYETATIVIPDSLPRDMQGKTANSDTQLVNKNILDQSESSFETTNMLTLFGETPNAATNLNSLSEKKSKEIEIDTLPILLNADDITYENKPVLVSNLEEEQFKVIGDLKIGIPLYNIYLNEADEWSRCLVTEVEEWSLEQHRILSMSTIGYAHSLAGSSATVGFIQLSKLAKLLEYALDKAKDHPVLNPVYPKLFIASAEECRRLLHQFAAGCLIEPKIDLVQQLELIKLLGFREDIVLNGINDHNDKVVDVIISANESDRKTREKVTFIGQSNSDNSLLYNEDDIDQIDALDVDLAHIFEEEAQELLPALGGAIRQWSSHPENFSARSEILRTLHTLKGSSRLAGAMRLGELAHRMESEIEEIGTENLTTSILDRLNLRLDVLQKNFDALLKLRLHQTAFSISETIKVKEEMKAIEFGRPDQEVYLSTSLVNASKVVTDNAKQKPSSIVKSIIKPPASNWLPLDKKESGQSVRVRTRVLDRLVSQAGEVMLTRTRIESEFGELRGSLGDLTGNLDRLRQQLRDVEFHAETQMQTRMVQSIDSKLGFDPLEFDRFTRVQELTRMMAESVNDVATVQRNLQRTVESTEDDLVAQARQTRDLQRDLLRTRMEEFESISDRLYRVVRQASKDTNKQVKLDIVGGSIEVDRGVLERMTPSFEHLLRNCVAHGIEAPDKRVAIGKEAVGSIEIKLIKDGNDVVIEFKDDGVGLNYQSILEKAIAQKLIPKNSKLSVAETINLIFAPGLSTASNITELSGRGIGLDVVRTDIISLGGRIDVSSEPNKGSRFKLILPLTTAVTQVVMMRSGSLSFGVPSHLVEVVRRAPLADVEAAYVTSQWLEPDENIPFYWSGALLQASQRSSEPLAKTNAVIIFRSAGQRTAIHVDEIFGNKEVVIKNLGPQLSRLPGLTGMAILVSGAVALIYNPVALAAVYGTSVLQYSPSRGQEADASVHGPTVVADKSAEQQTPLVLVVDDSITVRRVTQRMLQREGFRVVLAVDGLQAIEKLNLEVPDIVLSDIEMPRMDGFDLVRNIRSDAKLKHLPIVMITSRIAEKHRDLAKELGVNDYLGKPYSEEDLLNVLRQHTAKKIPSPETH